MSVTKTQIPSVASSHNTKGALNLPEDFHLPSEGDLVELEKRSDELTKAFSKRIDNLDIDMSVEEKRITEEESRGFKGLGLDGGVIKTTMLAVEMKVKKMVTTARLSMDRNNSKDLDDMGKRLNTYGDTLSGLMSIYGSAQALLTAQHLGDPKRSEYRTQVAGLAPMALLTLAKLAKSTGNLPLAAEILMQNDNLPRASRSFSSQAFADDMVGKTHAKFLALHTKLQGAMVMVNNRRTEFRTGRVNSLARISSGLAQNAAGLRDPEDKPNGLEIAEAGERVK